MFSRDSLAQALEILSLTPLQVPEGESVPITPRHIDLVLDYPKYGVRDSGVILRIIEPPKNGAIIADIWENPTSEPTFTLLDLAKDKVNIVYDFKSIYK